MKKILIVLKKNILLFTPEWALLAYHGTVAYLGALLYGFPAKSMVVVGITGTKGKTTTANILFDVLSTTYKTGLITTANIRIGDESRLNPWHMTMPGRAKIQKILSEMKKKGVTHVIVETTSEGLKQHRHYGIFYDIAIFTNLSPEHLPSHNNSFVAYRKAKEILFASLYNGIKNVSFPYTQAIYVNKDDKEAEHFLQYEVKEKKAFGLKSGDVVPTGVAQDGEYINFTVDGANYKMKAYGTYFVYNALPAILLANNLHIKKENVQKALRERSVIPGRMEEISVPHQNFKAFVDYAHEKLSMERLAETVGELKKSGLVKKWIVLLGAEGGGRDKRKRRDMGEVVGRYADSIVISNTDPYEEDELSIALDIAQFVKGEGRVEGKDYFIVLDRKEGMRKAVSLAQEGDIITITGNGSQQFYHRKGERVPHDDREVLKELLAERVG